MKDSHCGSFAARRFVFLNCSLVNFLIVLLTFLYCLVLFLRVSPFFVSFVYSIHFCFLLLPRQSP